MKHGSSQLAGEYAAALRNYLARGSEDALLQAYQSGRGALARGLGVLDLAALHQDALVGALLEMLAAEASQTIVQRAAQFFAESLAPFEMTQRGLRDLTSRLRDSNERLQERVRTVLEEYGATRDELAEQRRLDRLKDEFISIVSHELRTPLTSIRGSLGLVRDGRAGELPAKARELVDIAYRNSERLVRLASDLLDLQKIESGLLAFDVRALDLAPLLAAAVEANQAYASRFDVALVLTGAAGGARVLADADRLMQVLTNLLSNAAKFSPPKAQVILGAEPCGTYVRISVRDRGFGIPSAFRARVFERFAQADTSTTRAREGTGLGLSISKAIVERLCGRIGFESEESVGTTFFIDLPRPAEDASAGGRSARV